MWGGSQETSAVLKLLCLGPGAGDRAARGALRPGGRFNWFMQDASGKDLSKRRSEPARSQVSALEDYIWDRHLMPMSPRDVHEV